MPRARGRGRGRRLLSKLAGGRKARASAAETVAEQPSDREPVSEQNFAEEIEEQNLRIRALESALRQQREATKKATEESVPSPSEASSDSDASSSDTASSDSDSSCESEPAKKRKKYKKSKSKTGKKCSSGSLARSRLSSKRWKNPSYERQYQVNAAALRQIRKAQRQLKRKSYRSARSKLDKGEKMLADRQEWLVIADTHGNETASNFAEGGEMLEIVGSSEKRRRLMAAIQGSKPSGRTQFPAGTQPFRARTPSQGSKGWGAAPNAQTASAARSRGVCHNCGEPGHYVKFCPKRQGANKPE